MNQALHLDQEQDQIQRIITRTLELLLSMSSSESINIFELPNSAFSIKLAEKIHQHQELLFILPAFPAKSANLDKTSGPLPDMGELLALLNLNKVCREISSFYQPGAKVVICSDGRVFNDLVLVSDENLLLYKNKINQMIREFSLTHLEEFSLEDCMCESSFVKMREKLVLEFGPDLDSLKFKVKHEETALSLYNGLHRFIVEDRMFLEKEKTKSKISKESKVTTYQVMQRSQAWDKLLERYFADTLRLSIHPYPLTHHKFGVKLVKSSDKWATPWHNVVVKQGGHYQLRRRAEALSMGAEEKRYLGEYIYYEL